EPHQRLNFYIALDVSIGEMPEDDMEILQLPRERIISMWLRAYTDENAKAWLQMTLDIPHKRPASPELSQFLLAQPRPWDKITLMEYLEHSQINNMEIYWIGY